MDLRQPPSPAQNAGANAGNLPVLVLLVVLLCMTGFLLFQVTGGKSANSGGSETGEHLREVAAKLKAAGLDTQAAQLYGEYVRNTAFSKDKRASVAYGLGQQHLEGGRYEEALRWLYEAQALGSQNSGLAKKIVHSLEALGRVNEAQAALRAGVQMPSGSAQEENSDGIQRPSSDKLIAQIGEDKIYQSDIRRAIDDLPPSAKQHFSAPEAFEDFARKYVADELIWRKAQKREYTADPEVRRQMAQMLKSVVINRFIEKEVLGASSPQPADLQTFYQANPARYATAPQYQLSMIKLADAATAAEIQTALSAGKSFASLAQKHSLHTASKRTGGRLKDWTSLSPGLIPQIEQGLDPARVVAALKDLTGGAHSTTIGGGSHFYIFSVLGSKPGQSRSFEQVEKQVARDYQQTRAQAAYSELIAEELRRPDVHMLLGGGR